LAARQKKSSRPVTTRVQQEQQPKAGGAFQQYESRWSVSFTFWNQIRYFGLDGVNVSWCISFLEGLRNLEEHLDALFDGNPGLRRDLHFHGVKWDQAKVAIDRAKLDWLPGQILNNEREFPMFQVAVGKGPLRVVGFGRQSEKTFYIVLIDPYHNIHRSVGFEGAQDCGVLLNVHERLVGGLHDILHNKICDDTKCGQVACATRGHLENLHTACGLRGQIFVDQDYLEQAVVLIQQGKVESCEQIFIRGVDSLL